MQDGEPPHVAAPVQQLIRSTFEEDRAINRPFPLTWPPRSPGLTALDLWLWEFLRSKVDPDKPPSLTKLKHAIRQHVSAIPQEMLLNDVNGVAPRLTAVLLNDGQHIEQLGAYL
ncbi:hypothetical protein AVEN_243951-1 [Araneus ventricosus]|uniref:Tc1-like transposase DDE domain-containing protein n=1 Tax=Araneus ventricosus TaxID=182803 RepID=A0A4Y2RMZ5_ARAVE|nr:hypothetical protein AVEN_243951-1 [Araneus ventricosus]